MSDNLYVAASWLVDIWFERGESGSEGLGKEEA
jgi:hypothetical protein